MLFAQNLGCNVVVNHLLNKSLHMCALQTLFLCFIVRSQHLFFKRVFL